MRLRLALAVVAFALWGGCASTPSSPAQAEWRASVLDRWAQQDEVHRQRIASGRQPWYP